MELRTKTLDAKPPRKAYSNIYQAYVEERKKQLGKDYCPIEAKEKFAKISKSEKEKLQKIMEAEEERFAEELFHYNNAINNRGKRRYSVPAKIPEKPKKPTGVYFRFVADNRDAYVAKNKNLPYQKVLSLLTDDYSKLSSRGLKEYQDAYEKDHAAYLIELKKWTEKYGKDAEKAKGSKSRRIEKKRRNSSKSKSSSKSKDKSGSKSKSNSKTRAGSKGKNGSKTRAGSKGKNGSKTRAGSKGKNGSKTRSSSKGKSDSKSKTGSKTRSSSTGSKTRSQSKGKGDVETRGRSESAKKGSKGKGKETKSLEGKGTKKSKSGKGAAVSKKANNRC